MTAPFENTGKFFTAASGCLLALSVVYDYAYLQALNLSFAAVPTSLSDHVRSAIVWLPTFGAFSAFGFLLGAGTKPTESTQSSKPFRLRPVDVATLPIVGLFLFGVAWLAEPTLFFLALAALIGFVLVRFRISVVNLTARFGNATAQLALAAPSILALVAISGFLDGRLLLAESPARWSVTLKRETSFEEIQVLGIRRFSSVAILVGEGRTIQIVPAESVVSAKREFKESRALPCLFSESLCSKAK